MNDTSESELIPPPLPVESAEISRAAAASPAYLRSWPWLLIAAAGSAVATDAALWTEGVFHIGFGGYGVALATVCGAGALAAMRRDLDFKTPAWLLLAATAAASLWVGSGLSAILAPVLLVALACRPFAGDFIRTVTGVLKGPVMWVGSLFGACRGLFSKLFRGRFTVWAVAAVTMVFFLVLLTFGNAALAKHLETTTHALSDVFRIRTEDMVRLCLWGGGVVVFGLLAAPRAKDVVPGILVETPAKPAPVALAALVGANLAFLASNLTDTWWLGIMRTAPEGVSTTDYLYDGAYVLMLDAAIAGALLLKLFAADGASRGDRRAKFAGYALVIQCAWLGLGVAGRLALQMDKFGFTPVRLWGVVLLAWGFVGLWGVWRHLRNMPSLRAFVRLAAWSAIGGLCVLQFRPPAVLSVDLNLACYRQRPEWRFDVGYYDKVGPEGWRLYREVEHHEANIFRPTVPAEDGWNGWLHDRFVGSFGEFVTVPGYLGLNWRVRSLRLDALCREWREEHPDADSKKTP